MVLLKCRDRDAHLREAAFEILAAMPAASLHAVVTADEWRSVLEYGLGISGEPARAQFMMEGMLQKRL